MRIAVFDCPSGIAGDMTVGAFLDAGLPFSYLEKELRKLNLKGYEISVKKVSRGPFRGSKFNVHLKSRIPDEVHTLGEIESRIQKSRLGPQTKTFALRIFKVLARAEAKIHGQSVRRIHFHEAGALDSLLDVVGASIAIRYFGIKKSFVRNLAIGRRAAVCIHGHRVSNPSPGTLELLRGFVLERTPIDAEIVTPTGAAILAAVCEKEEAIPSMKLGAVGYGAGDKTFEGVSNLLRISLGETVAPYRRERILLLETNLDDMSPQGFELLYERLFRAGALDVWVESILMKKMRPAFKLSVLLDHHDQEKISEVIFKETPSLGVRFLELDRFSLPRKTFRRQTPFGPVRFKMGFLDSRQTIMRPEYEDVKRIAVRKNLPFQRVYRELTKNFSVGVGLGRG